MKALVRALILLATAGGFCVALSLSAQADVVEPNSAYQPASVGLLEKGSPAAGQMPAVAKAGSNVAKAEVAKAEAPSEAVEATPAPEQQVVRQVPTAIVRPDSEQAPSVADRVFHPLRMGVEHLRTSLGRVVSACTVGFGTGAGGPVLVLGVLCMALPFIRRRVFATRWATDEDAPEFLFALELTPPG